LLNDFNALQPIGALVVKAWRETPLEQRTEDAFPNQMLPYAVGREHCLATGVQLLCAWTEAERDPARRDEIAASLFAGSGRWTRYGDRREWISVGDDVGVVEG
jgi:hypothetical protein